jgi:malate synthase
LRYFRNAQSFDGALLLLLPASTGATDSINWGKKMSQRVQVGGLQVAKELYDFINTEALPGTGVEVEQFWSRFDSIVHDLAPRNRELLAKRDALQAKIDEWHRAHRGAEFDFDAYKSFLQSIGYLLPEGEAFTITTENVDPEMATMAGPQLVVPVTNARYALNAANARWGSLYDALYGTDAIRRRAGGGLQPGPWRQGDRLRAHVPRPERSASGGLAQGLRRLQHPKRSPLRGVARWQRDRAEKPGPADRL